MEDGIPIWPKYSIFFPQIISLAFKTLFNFVAYAIKWFCIQLRDHLSLFQSSRPKRCRSPWGTATHHFTQESTTPLACLLSACTRRGDRDAWRQHQPLQQREPQAAPRSPCCQLLPKPRTVPIPKPLSCCSACGCCLRSQPTLAASHLTDLSWAQGRKGPSCTKVHLLEWLPPASPFELL